MTPNTQTGTICATVDVDGDAAQAVIYKNGAALKGGRIFCGGGRRRFYLQLRCNSGDEWLIGFYRRLCLLTYNDISYMQITRIM